MNFALETRVAFLALATDSSGSVARPAAIVASERTAQTDLVAP